MNNPRNLAMAGVGVAGALYFLPINPFNTYGTQNIGKAWSRAGGSTTHTPAIATKLGDHTSNISNQMHAKGESGDDSGVDTKHFQDHHTDQRVGEPGMIKKAMHQAHYGSDKGKGNW